MRGLGVSDGIGCGRAFKLSHSQVQIKKYTVLDTEKEVLKLHNAIEDCKKQLEDLYEHTKESIGENEAEIFKAHQMILEDEVVIDEITTKIRYEKINAEYALKAVAKVYIDMFDGMGDEYLRERIHDIKDIIRRIIFSMQGVSNKKLSDIEDNTVIVARELTPSDTAMMDKDKVVAMIVEEGGRTSHAAIIARTLEIPTIIGPDGIYDTIKDKDLIVCDGATGIININPSEDVFAYYDYKKNLDQKIKIELKNEIGKQTVTTDGYRTILAANIGTPDDVKPALDNDAEGIGLFRSEFLYMSREELPSEEEQFVVYKQVLEGMNNRPVIIRTLDIGGDKKLSYLDIPDEQNPFLGYRAIRLCLDKEDIFKTQLKAILRASVYGNAKIMFPMISGTIELRQAKEVLEQSKEELRQKNIAFDENIDIGIMIEIPSAAIISDILIKEVDFFSIGTNDLIQYTMAVDRMNSKINYLCNQYHPALLRLIKSVIDNAKKEGKWVGMCGESAGESKLIPLFVGMGLDEFSMSPSTILNARHIIRNISKKEMEEVVKTALSFATASEVEEYLTNKFN